ncbi:hypothetical protein HCN58_12825 [Bradyrhizobium sp. WSM 1791]|uniref:MOFRL domain-containing protein n=1 Tax=Bradyrhizobium australiense TaxID=2721161 RepID=A0A7Y4GS69_9BRAD|nr:hypothetical protein [Bradyrhizobium australiense]
MRRLLRSTERCFRGANEKPREPTSGVLCFGFGLRREPYATLTIASTACARKPTVRASVQPDTLERARAGNLEPRAFVAAHDSYSFCAAIGDPVRTGPTDTNVNDIRTILITKGG